MRFIIVHMLYTSVELYNLQVALCNLARVRISVKSGLRLVFGLGSAHV